jgi:hypothetical protein
VAGGLAGGSQIILAINKNGNYSSGTKSISVKIIKRAHFLFFFCIDKVKAIGLALGVFFLPEKT